MARISKMTDILLKMTGLFQHLPIGMQKKVAGAYIDYKFKSDIKIKIKNGNILKETEGPCIFHRQPPVQSGRGGINQVVKNTTLTLWRGQTLPG